MLFTITALLFIALLLSLSHLVVIMSCLVAHALLLELPCFHYLPIRACMFVLCCPTITPCYLAITPCCFTLLIDGPCSPTTMLWCFALLVVDCLPLLFAFFRYLLTPPPLVASLSCFCCLTTCALLPCHHALLFCLFG
jgi:hypothetical protein